MNEIRVFNNPEFGNIRTVMIDGEPWLVGKDVAVALGYSNPRDALIKHVDDDDKRVSRITTPSGEQQMKVINESGVYSLIFSSKLPKAKQFKRWVTSEVLPSIRKRGGYLTPEAQEKLDTILTGFQSLADRVEALERTAGREPQFIAPGAGEMPDYLPGKAALKRWMRTVSEKLDLLSARSNKPHYAILHKLYGYIEAEFNVVLDEERLRTMEELGLDECSVLKAVFYNEDFRDFAQRVIDYNLAPENRGW